MTEMSPVGVVNQPTVETADRRGEHRAAHVVE